MFALIYCPNFFIQCERIFRPELSRHALVIASSDDNGTSRIITSSPQAQNLGLVRGLSGDQFDQAISKTSNNKTIRLISPNYELYSDLSARFLKSLSLLAPTVSAYASDEAFINLNDLEQQEDFYRYACELRKKLKQWLGLSVFIGIAPTRALAKLAANAAQTVKEPRQRIRRTQGIVDISELGKRHKLLAQVTVSDITGVSKKVANQLSEINVHTALELSKAPKHQVRRRSSVVIERIALELSGLSCKELELNVDARNSPLASTSRAEVHTYNQAKRALKAQVSSAEEQLNSLKCSCEKVIISLAIQPLNQDNTPFQASLSSDLVKASNSSNAIRQLATQLLESLWRESHQYCALTLSLEGLRQNTGDQFGLFSSPIENDREYEPPKSINIKTLFNPEPNSGSTVVWRDKKSWSSPSFTSNWGDIPRVS